MSKKITKLLKRNVCWIFFGVVVSLLPLVSIIYALLIGYSVTFNDYLPDIVLIVVSIGCNFINLCIDIGKKINPIPRIIIPAISVLIIFFSWGFYCFIKRENIGMLSTWIISIFNFVIIITWLIGGIVINCKALKENSK